MKCDFMKALNGRILPLSLRNVLTGLLICIHLTFQSFEASVNINVDKLNPMEACNYLYASEMC